jgi:hypothetical protein
VSRKPLGRRHEANNTIFRLRLLHKAAANLFQILVTR